MTTSIRPAVLAILTALAASAATAEANHCQIQAFAGNRYAVCRFDTTKDQIRLFHSDASNAPYRNFAALDASLRARGNSLAFAMNAGMYHEDRSPVGMFVEDGIMHRPLNSAEAAGNFYLKPNGVFFVAEGRAGVLESDAFSKSQISAQFATQSGPMLVIDGDIHPRFDPTSTSRNIRNGVGVADDGRSVLFAISETPVTFHEFATFFRVGLSIKNALYLDGVISRLYAPELGRSDPGADMGPIVGVTLNNNPPQGAAQAP